MATIPMVTTRDDLASLVKISLEQHHIPVTAVFDVFENSPEGRFIAVSTPLAESKGLRKAYLSVFETLEKETFALKSFLRLHTLVLSPEELKEIRHALKKGMSEATVPYLAHLQDVIVRPAEEAKNIRKTGMLNISAHKDGSYTLAFGGFARSGGGIKTRKINSLQELGKVLAALGVRISQESLASSTSVVLTSSLETLYQEGLI